MSADVVGTPKPVRGPFPVSLAPMRRRHLRQVCAIEEAVQPRPWSAGLFESELDRDDRAYLVAEQLGQLPRPRRVVGYGGIMLAVDEAHITNVAVSPLWRRRGVASLLILELLEAGLTLGATAATLEVRASNHGAQRLYSRFGFAPVGVRPGYYPDTAEDAIIMWAFDIDGPDACERRDVVRRSIADREGI